MDNYGALAYKDSAYPIGGEGIPWQQTLSNSNYNLLVRQTPTTGCKVTIRYYPHGCVFEEWCSVHGKDCEVHTYEIATPQHFGDCPNGPNCKIKAAFMEWLKLGNNNATFSSYLFPVKDTLSAASFWALSVNSRYRHDQHQRVWPEVAPQHAVYKNQTTYFDNSRHIVNLRYVFTEFYRYLHLVNKARIPNPQIYPDIFQYPPPPPILSPISSRDDRYYYLTQYLNETSAPFDIPDRVIHHHKAPNGASLFVLIKDMFPKSHTHWLLLPAGPRAIFQQLALYAFDDPRVLRHVQRLVRIAVPILTAHLEREFGPHHPYHGRWHEHLQIGHHAEQSCYDMHVHIKTRDISGPFVKSPAYYNTFNTGLFMDLFKKFEYRDSGENDAGDFPLDERDPRRWDRANVHRLHCAQLVCWKCGRNFGDTGDENWKVFKTHLEVEKGLWLEGR